MLGMGSKSNNRWFTADPDRILEDQGFAQLEPNIGIKIILKHLWHIGQSVKVCFCLCLVDTGRPKTANIFEPTTHPQ